MLGPRNHTNEHATPDDALRNACTVSADDANYSRFFYRGDGFQVPFGVTVLPRAGVSGRIVIMTALWLRLHRTTLQSGRKEVGPRVVHEAETGATHVAIWFGFMRRRAVADRT